MNSRRWRCACLAGVAVTIGLIAAPVVAALKIAGISAQLFLRDTGKLSPDLLQTSDLLGNAVTSGDSVLVVITITDGGDDRLPAPERVRLVAIEEAPAFAVSGTHRPARRLLDRTAAVAHVPTGESTHVGFWLDRVGCAPIRLTASLEGGGRGTSRQEVIGFQCYE
ncbi:hypothetical protein ACSBM8_13270 [Sphingomonas sp. ASY06-1R]|uniref:hypothetical protein n=1 Tax=Sphingomonas sp. ASY06-1R TaxID=3445771 RepID=UPI003FA1AB6E